MKDEQKARALGRVLGDPVVLRALKPLDELLVGDGVELHRDDGNVTPGDGCGATCTLDGFQVRVPAGAGRELRLPGLLHLHLFLRGAAQDEVKAY